MTASTATVDEPFGPPCVACDEVRPVMVVMAPLDPRRVDPRDPHRGYFRICSKCYVAADSQFLQRGAPKPLAESTAAVAPSGD